MDRKHRGKRTNCSLRAISPFPTVFTKDLFCEYVKTRACLGWVTSFLVCKYDFHGDDSGFGHRIAQAAETYFKDHILRSMESD